MEENQNIDITKIHTKWQEKWEENQIYKVNENNGKDKFYILDMFPYPSGSGLHVGHPKGYIASDVIARKKILQGYNVLHPMGFDTFGLGTENYAIEHKMKPQDCARQNIEIFKKQLSMFGCTYDWDRSFSTADKDYFKRTQRIFLKLYNHYYDEKEKKALSIDILSQKIENKEINIPSDTSKEKFINNQRLAFVDYKPINWCPNCKTGLANEDLEDGKHERCGTQVEQKMMRQWVLRITKYAEKLLEGLDNLPEWDDSVKDMQANWIGKSIGTEFEMEVEGFDDKLSIYTTRIDTVFGMSFVAIAPEHPLVEKITNQNFRKKVEEYAKKANQKTTLERTELQKEKSGQFCGTYAINPFNNERIPIFVADYVLVGYGTGVVMAVPAHDERDYEFAKKYKLPIKQSIKPNKKRKALIIHGFEANGESNWFLNLKQKLEKLGWEVESPTYPNSSNPNYDEVMNFLQKYYDNLDEDSIIIGHSLGCKFILKLLETYDKKIGSTILVAPVANQKLEKFEDKFGRWENSDIQSLKRIWEIDLDYNKINKNSINRTVILSDNDPRINLNTKNLFDKTWNIEILNEKGHFSLAEDSDLFEIIFQNIPCYTEKGTLVNSEKFNGLSSEEAIKDMQKRLKEENIGGEKINYKIQDWVFSRQRYRGEPIPMIHCKDCGVVALEEKDLPLDLPDVENYEPTGTQEGPLANIEERINIKCPKCGGMAKRESNTMPGWAGSSWYWIRYMDNQNDNELISSERDEYWKNVDVYVGGAEHITRHMIYARFWQKFLNDIGVIKENEPFKKYQKVGLIMAEDGRKMSKRWGNVINPDDIIQEYGSDSLRVYEMFMGPFDQSIARSTKSVKGVSKFLEKIIKLHPKVNTNYTDDKKVISLLHKTIKKVTEDIDQFKFNTCISQMMILVNELSNQEKISKNTFEKLLLILSPFAPHLSEELWELIGNEFSIFNNTKRPDYDSKLLLDDVINLAVQFNGKMRGTIEVSPNLGQDEIMNLLKEDQKFGKYLEGNIIKIIFIPQRIINIIIK